MVSLKKNELCILFTACIWLGTCYGCAKFDNSLRDLAQSSAAPSLSGHWKCEGDKDGSSSRFLFIGSESESKRFKTSLPWYAKEQWTSKGSMVARIITVEDGILKEYSAKFDPFLIDDSYYCSIPVFDENDSLQYSHIVRCKIEDDGQALAMWIDFDPKKLSGVLKSGAIKAKQFAGAAMSVSDTRKTILPLLLKGEGASLYNEMPHLRFRKDSP